MERYLILTGGFREPTARFAIQKIELEFEDEYSYRLKGDVGNYQKFIFGQGDYEIASNFFYNNYEEAVTTRNRIIRTFIKHKKIHIDYIKSLLHNSYRDLEKLDSYLNHEIEIHIPFQINKNKQL